MSLVHLLILILVAAAIGAIAERLINRSMPFGLLGAILAGFLGAWLMVDVLHVIIVPELAIEGIPLISALLGAIVIVFLFSLLTGRYGGYSWRSWRRF